MFTEKNQVQSYPRAASFLIACGAIGPILFILLFLVESAIRPGYSAWHNFVSDLGESNQGWMQIANFLICGVLILCFALGLRPVFRSGKGSVWGPLLLGVFGLSLLIAGLFVTDPAWRGWALYSLVAGMTFVGSFIACLASAVLDQKGILPNSPTGLLERISILIGWIWIALLALRLLRQMRAPVSSARCAGEADAVEHVDQTEAGFQPLETRTHEA